MSDNRSKALVKVLNTLLGKKITNVVHETERVGFALSDGRTVWVRSGPEADEIGWLHVEKK